MTKPRPDEPFESGRVFALRVDRHSQISVRTNRYAVPVRLISRRVRAVLHASELVVNDGRTEVVRHERLMAKGGARLERDHYLECWCARPERCRRLHAVIAERVDVVMVRSGGPVPCLFPNCADV